MAVPNYRKEALRNTLALNIRRFHKDVPMWSWTGETPGADIDSVFVDKLDLKGPEGLRGYSDILSRYDTEKRRRFVIVGDAGVGKETIARRLLVDWSQRVLQPGDSENLIYMDRYQYVVPIFCSNIITLENTDGDLTLAEIIENQLEFKMEHARLLLDLVGEDPKSALFVIIGYSMLVAVKSEDLRRLVNGAYLSHVNCLITCRTYVLYGLPGILRDEDIEVRGFTPFGPEDYVNRFWSIKNIGNNSAKQLLKKIGSQSDLKTCSTTPALLLLMCILWSEGGTLSDTMTGLYKEFLRYMCGRYERYHVTRRKRSAVKDLLDKYMDPLLDISSLAKRGMILNGLETSFPYESAKEMLSDLSWNLGFLTTGKTRYLSKVVQFHHRTMQEFFIGLGVVYSTKGDGMQVLMNMCSSAQRLSNSRIILAFVCGLSEVLSLRVKALIEHEIEIWDETDKTNSHIYRADFLVRLAQETSSIFSLPSVIHLDPTLYEPKALAKFFSMAGENVKEIVLTNIGQLNEISWLSRLDYAKLNSLEIHGVQKPTDDDADINVDVIHPGVIIKSLCPKVIKFMDIRDNKGLATTLAFLYCMGELEAISFVKCALESNGIFALARILNIEQDCAKVMSATAIQISELYLHHCQCYDSQAMTTLIQTLPQQPNLTVFSSIDNRLGTGGILALADVMSSVPRLRVLRIVSAHCADQHNWSRVIGSLACTSSLEDIDFSNNNIGEAGVRALVSVLQQGSIWALRKIWLNVCNINESKVVLLLLQNLQYSPHISDLSLSANALGDTLKDITVTRFPSSIKTLNIANNRLSGTIVDHILCFFKDTHPDMKVIVDELTNFSD